MLGAVAPSGCPAQGRERNPDCRHHPLNCTPKEGHGPLWTDRRTKGQTDAAETFVDCIVQIIKGLRVREAERWGSPWTGYQFITRLTPFTHLRKQCKLHTDCEALVLNS